MKQNEIKHGKLQVDFLRHISDQGLALQMVDPKLQAVIDGLKQDGITVLEAGYSKLTITKIAAIEAEPANKQFDGEHTKESIGAMYSAIAQTFNFAV